MAIRPKEMAAWLGEYWGIGPQPTAEPAPQPTAEPAPPPAPDESLTVKQAAERMSVSERKVYDLVAAGELGHYKVGRTIRIRPEDIAAFQSQPTEKPAEKPDRYRHFKL